MDNFFGFEHGARRMGDMKTQRNFRAVDASGGIQERMVLCERIRGICRSEGF